VLGVSISGMKVKGERHQMLMKNSGYVALAVATESGTYKRELNTELGPDREANMIAFAVESLKLLRDVIKGDAKL
jgi:hypothetical protein